MEKLKLFAFLCGSKTSAYIALLKHSTLTNKRLTMRWNNMPSSLVANWTPTRYGFITPLGRHGSEYIHSANGYIMICAKRQDKILPSGVIKEHLEEEVLKINAEEGRNVSRKERDSLKDDIIFDLLPKAFTKNSLDFAYIATREKLFVVNASSDKRAEDLISALRDAVGSLKLVPIVPKSIPTHVMTQAIRDGSLGDPFEIGEECELRAAKDERVVACKKTRFECRRSYQSCRLRYDRE